MTADLREHFWSERPWPEPLEVVRLETHVVPSRGRAGRWLLDEVELRYRGRRITGLLAFAPRLQPGQVTEYAERLTRIVHHSLANRFAEREPVRLVCVEVASPALLAACRRERLGLLDLSGTIDLDTPEVLLQVEGRKTVRRKPRVSPFSSLGVRLVRALLLTLDEPRTTTALAQALHASYSSVWSALAGLEALGLVERRHGAGPIVVDPRGLLRSWCERGSAPIREGWFCPDTTTKGLGGGLEKLKDRGAEGLFTYRSGLLDAELFVSGLPHGLRTAASSSLVVEAFGLRPVTPHNFFILRDEGGLSGFGSVGMAPREVPGGLAVSVPQLVSDLHHAGGRLAEQADALAERWWRALPPRPIDD